MTRKALANAYKRLTRLKGRQLVQFICEATLHASGQSAREPLITSQSKVNPFFEVMALEGYYYPTVCTTHRDVAKIFLDQIIEPHKYGVTGSPIQTSEYAKYLKLSDYIAQWTTHPIATDLPDWLLVSPHIEQIMGTFFFLNQQCFDDAVDQACRLVYHGIPLFQLHDDGNFVRLSANDHNYIYLAKKAEIGETSAAAASGAEGRLPSWAETYFVHKDHLAELRNYYQHDGVRLNNSAVLPLREAFLRKIGIDSKGEDLGDPPGKFHRPLLQVLRKVLDRDCPGLFSDDPNHWPAQKQVIEWLKSNKRLTHRRAEIIAVIATPES